MWPWESYFLSLYLSFFQLFMCVMHSDCDLLRSGSVSPTRTWQFCKKSSALSHLDLMSVTQKWAVLRKKMYQIYFSFINSLLWLKQTHWAFRIWLLYVTNWCNNFTAPSISRHPLPFSLSVTQKSLGLLQPRAMLQVSESRKMFNNS